MIERIAAAAVIYDGLIFSMASPARHGDVLRKLDETLRGLGATQERLALLPGLGQGFTTSAGRYVGRKEAYMIAKEAGQLLDDVGRPPNLFSEDVW